MQTYESFFKLLGNEIQLTKREMEKKNKLIMKKPWKRTRIKSKHLIDEH